MKTNPINPYSLKWALALHGVLLSLVILVPLVPGCRPKDVEIPLDFTVVLDANLVEPNVPDVTPEPEPVKAPAPKPPPPPEPPKPQPLPEPPKDVVPVETKKPDPPKEKKPEVKKPDPPKPPPKKPDPPKEKKPEFKKGQRVEAPPPKPKQPRFEETYKPYDPSKPTSTKPVTDPKLSRAEIEKALRDGARVGTRNSIPEDEVSRCVVLVRRALFDAWEQPGEGDAGPRPALLDIRLDSAGRIVSYRIRQSSGSAYFDQTVLKAAANAQAIRGLTVAFLKQYETLTIEFKLE